MTPPMRSISARTLTLASISWWVSIISYAGLGGGLEDLDAHEDVQALAPVLFLDGPEQEVELFRLLGRPEDVDEAEGEEAAPGLADALGHVGHGDDEGHDLAVLGDDLDEAGIDDGQVALGQVVHLLLVEGGEAVDVAGHVASRS